MSTSEIKWQLLAERQLNCIGTKINIDYLAGAEPYHVYRAMACHGCFDTLDEAKAHVIVVMAELMEMGVDP